MTTLSALTRRTFLQAAAVSGIAASAPKGWASLSAAESTSDGEDLAQFVERAPGYRQADFSLFKDFHVWQEHVVGFRADFFNAFNLVSYGYPHNNINDSSFGVIDSVRSPERQIQLALHYSF